MGESIVQKMKYEVKINLLANPMILTGKKMPEYLINGWIGDRKSPKKASLSNVFKSAVRQGCQVVVIDLEKYPYNLESMLNKLPKIFQNKEAHKTVERIIIVDKTTEKVVEWIRSK